MKHLNLRTIILLFLLIVSSAWIGLWIVRVIQNISQPQIEYSEGFNMYLGRLFSTGQWSWQLSTSPPFNVSFYPPIGFYVLGYFQRLFGETLISGRVLNLCYIVGCMAMVHLIVQHETKDKLVSLIAAMLPMTAITMIAWSFFIRVDLLAVFFDLAGLYLVVRFKNTKGVYLAVPLFLLAFFTKTVLPGMIASIVYLFIKNRRQGITLALVMACFIEAITLAANLLTHGNYIREVYLYQRTSPAYQSPTVVIVIVLICLALYLPATVMAAAWWSKQKKHLLQLFAVIALIINIVNLLHPGGNFNYLFETIFAVCILAGMYLASVDIEKSFNVIVTASIFMAALLFLAVSGLYGESFPTKQYREDYAKAVSILKEADYPILTENAGMVLDAGQVPYYEPFVFTNLARLGYWNEGKLLSDLASKKIQYVVTEYPLPDPAVLRIDTATQTAIISNYHVILESGITKTSGKGINGTGIYAEYSFVLWKTN